MNWNDVESIVDEFDLFPAVIAESHCRLALVYVGLTDDDSSLWWLPVPLDLLMPAM